MKMKSQQDYHLEPVEINPMGKDCSSNCLHENMRKSTKNG